MTQQALNELSGQGKKCSFPEEPEVSFSGLAPLEKPERVVRPRNLFNNDGDYFWKGEDKPSLFNVKVSKDLYAHLAQNDLDDISKNEVAYKILKEQLRQQQ